jgi:protein arginine kinase
MVNEEDHLRMQVLRSGLHLNDAFTEISRIDNELGKILNFAFSGKYGYLTACPTNVGTGLRVSVMLHLPGLKISGEIERAIQASRDLQLAIRGLYGEGTDAVGDFYQISNQITLGRNEEEIVDNFVNRYIPEILSYERRAREALMKNNRLEIEDRVCRSMAIVGASRLICSDETLRELSMIRLGINLRILDNVNLKTINELFLLSRPAHLQKIHGDELTPRERDRIRSELLRSRLGPQASSGEET